MPIVREITGPHVLKWCSEQGDLKTIRGIEWREAREDWATPALTIERHMERIGFV